MALTWKLSELRQKFRALTGLISDGQLSDDACDDKINDYYQHHFPKDVTIEDIEGEFTQLTAAADSGDYSVVSTVLLLVQPVYINGVRARLYVDSELFWRDYPKVDIGSPYCMTSPTLAIGSSSKAAVANGAFLYRINDSSYSKGASETNLSGDSVPADKYGIWRLEIATDGTISITAATANGTGYDTPGKALAALNGESGSSATMGYVIVVNTSEFVPGTTLLDAAGVTATYTNGFNSTRRPPTAALLNGGILSLRPKPNDIYLFQCRQKGKPDALSGDKSLPADPAWGPAIAYGSAIEYLRSIKDPEGADALVSVWQYYIGNITKKALIQNARNRRARPRF